MPSYLKMRSTVTGSSLDAEQFGCVVSPLQQSYLARILNARVYEVATETPLQPARNMSRILKNNILFKVVGTQEPITLDAG